MAYLIAKASKQKQLAPTLVLVAIVLLASWMGEAKGGYDVKEWALVALLLATLGLVGSLAGAFRGTGSRHSAVALALFGTYTAWTFVTLLWSPNQGDAWLGAGQALLYLLVFWIALGLVSLGASRTWALATSAIGPAIVAAFTLTMLSTHIDDFFTDRGLLGTVGYFNGEAAFLLVPFWVSVYLAGSRSVSPILRGAVLAGATLCVELAVLTQSRGAMVAMAISLPVFFLLSAQRLRGLFALAPVALALLVALPGLNEVYLAFPDQAPVAAAIEHVLPTVWLTAAGAGLYGLLWGLTDQRWELASSVTRAIGGAALAASIAVLIFGAAAFTERVGNPITWSEQRWEAFKNDELTGQEQSRYLNAGGSGRYTFWKVSWEDFISHPLLGIGTYNYEATYFELREKVPSDARYVRHQHMLPLEVLSERGVIGGVLFFGFLATCVGAGLRERFKNLGSEGKAQVGAMIAAFTYWFVHACADWFLQQPAVTMPAMVYLAMLVGPWQRIEAAPARWPLRTVGAIVAGLAIIAVAPLYISDRYRAQSYATANPTKALEAIERAERFDPVDPWLRQREGNLAFSAGDWARAERAYSEAIRLNPEHYAPRLLQARFYEQREEPEKALQAYRQAMALNPLDEEVRREADEFASKVEAS
jgi:tetratricopeptide (TPR) repeat protein